MMRFIYIVAVFLLIFASVKLTKLILAKYHLNRWMIGAISPFVLIVPSILFPHLPTAVWLVLGTIFTVLCVMFFEISRELL